MRGVERLWLARQPHVAALRAPARQQLQAQREHSENSSTTTTRRWRRARRLDAAHQLAERSRPGRLRVRGEQRAGRAASATRRAPQEPTRGAASCPRLARHLVQPGAHLVAGRQWRRGEPLPAPGQRSAQSDRGERHC